jgi:hypothetical protein
VGNLSALFDTAWTQRGEVKHKFEIALGNFTKPTHRKMRSLANTAQKITGRNGEKSK